MHEYTEYLRLLIEPLLRSGFYIESFSILNHIETSQTVSVYTMSCMTF